MKKILPVWLLLAFFVATHAGAQIRVRVQGVERTLASRPAPTLKAASASGPVLKGSKVKYYVGEGKNTSYLIIRWNDGKGADNLVWGYRWDNEDKATGEDLIRAIAKTDPRFYVLAQNGTQYGTAFGGFGFDANGSKNLAIAKEGQEEVTANENGFIDVASYDFDNYTPVDATDRWRSGWNRGYWSYYVAKDTIASPGYASTGASGRQLTDGSIDLWSYSAMSSDVTTAEPTYYFYVPTPGQGVALPESMSLPLSDAGGMIPVIYDAGEETASRYWWQVSAQNDAAVPDMEGDAATVNGKATFATAGPGTYTVNLSIRMGKPYVPGNACALTLTAPVKPITAVSLSQKEFTLDPQADIDLSEYVTTAPADATFTGLSYSSSDPEVASVDATGKVTANKIGGTAVISVASRIDAQVVAQATVSVKTVPVSNITIDSDNGVIEMEVKDIYKPVYTVTPDNATEQDVEYVIADPSIASFYQSNIIAHKAGETTLTAKAKDRSGVSATVRLVVKETDRTPFNGYEDGTFLLNEGWFGHDNGSMNYLTADENLMYRVYERENPDEAFGATACYATIYGGRMYIISKQAADAGDTDTKAGGRLVVLDAKTLKKIAGLEGIGGDGRTIVGISPQKMYLGTTGGVVVFDAETLQTGKTIAGTEGQSTSVGQTGDMIKAGGHVFVAQQGVGVHIIDPQTDEITETIEAADIFGLVQSMDGTVWMGTQTGLTGINPTTLEIGITLQFPAGGALSSAWGAWQPTDLCASRTENVIFWQGGGSSWTAGTDFYRYEIGSDISTLKPIFTVSGLAGAEDGKAQEVYGCVRYDDRSGNLIIPTTQSGWGTNYEHNWILLVDGKSGELRKTIALKSGYWFQGLPVFPDKYAPEFNDVPESLSYDDEGTEATLDLTGKVTDRDNLAYNITLSVLDEGDTSIIATTLQDNTLFITPKSAGETAIVLAAESNGIITTNRIAIKVGTTDGLHGVGTNTEVITDVYDTNGVHVGTSTDGLPTGIYIVKKVNHTEKILKH